MADDTLVSRMKALKSKARAARKSGNTVALAAFKSGASRLQRQIKARRHQQPKATVAP